MGKQSDDDSMDDWINAINKGGIFGRRSSADKRIVDRSTATHFATAYQSIYGMEITNICDGPDPPDVKAQVGCKSIGLEMVELLKPEVRRKKVRAFPALAYPGQFEESQWTRNEFERGVNYLLDAKEEKYANRPEDWVADALIVHTDEDWLDWAAVQKWLMEVSFRPRHKIRSAYLLLFYSPYYPKPHWPLFRMFGEI